MTIILNQGVAELETDASVLQRCLKGSQMGYSVKASLWGVPLLIKTGFRSFYFRISNC